jgi:hypothetical protein
VLVQAKVEDADCFASRTFAALGKAVGHGQTGRPTPDDNVVIFGLDVVGSPENVRYAIGGPRRHGPKAQERRSHQRRGYTCHDVRSRGFLPSSLPGTEITGTTSGARKRFSSWGNFKETRHSFKRRAPQDGVPYML